MDNGANITLEHYQSLYPAVPEYFQATAIVNQYKSLTAYRNIIDSLDARAVASLLDIGTRFGLSAELQELLRGRIYRHNNSCQVFERVYLNGPPAHIVWDSIEETPAGTSAESDEIPALIDASLDFGSI